MSDWPDEDDFYMLVGGRIHRARREAGMSQQDMAVALKVYANTVSRWETATYRVSLYDLVRISGLLEKPLSWFLTPVPLVAS